MLRIYIIGAGTPTPAGSRFGTCYLVEVEDDLLMFDCGPAATYKMARMGVLPTMVTDLFFSHHHFDHNSDYPCFLLSRWDQAAGKGRPLRIYGPPPTALISERLFGEEGAFSYDWRARVEHPGSIEIYQKRGGEPPRMPPLVEVQEIGTGICAKGKTWQVSSQRVTHIDPWMPTYAYRLESAAGSLVLSSDTGFCRNIIQLSKNADCLLLHCWDLQEKMGNAEASIITGTTDAAKIAFQAGVSRLLLSHCNPLLDQYENRLKAEQDVKTIFNGRFEFVDELSIIEIE